MIMANLSNYNNNLASNDTPIYTLDNNFTDNKPNNAFAKINMASGNYFNNR